jgi:hypothetical protein
MLQDQLKQYNVSGIAWHLYLQDCRDSCINNTLKVLIMSVPAKPKQRQQE